MSGYTYGYGVKGHKDPAGSPDVQIAMWNESGVKGSCRLSLSGRAHALLLMVHLNFPLLSWGALSLWGFDVPFVECSPRWSTSVRHNPFNIMKKAKESLNKMFLCSISVCCDIFPEYFCIFKTSFVPDFLFFFKCISWWRRKERIHTGCETAEKYEFSSKWTNWGEDNCERLPQHILLSSWKSGAQQSSSQVQRRSTGEI